VLITRKRFAVAVSSLFLSVVFLITLLQSVSFPVDANSRVERGEV